MTVSIDAVYEAGVFRPLEQVPLDEGQRVHLVVETPGTVPSPAEMLALAENVYAGLSEEEIDEIEAIALDRATFFSSRADG